MLKGGIILGTYSNQKLASSSFFFFFFFFYHFNTSILSPGYPLFPSTPNPSPQFSCLSRNIWTPKIFIPLVQISQNLNYPLEIWVLPFITKFVLLCWQKDCTRNSANKMAHWSTRCHNITHNEFRRVQHFGLTRFWS